MNDIHEIEKGSKKYKDSGKHKNALGYAFFSCAVNEVEKSKPLREQNYANADVEQRLKHRAWIRSAGIKLVRYRTAVAIFCVMSARHSSTGLNPGVARTCFSMLAHN